MLNQTEKKERKKKPSRARFVPNSSRFLSPALIVKLLSKFFSREDKTKVGKIHARCPDQRLTPNSAGRGR